MLKQLSNRVSAKTIEETYTDLDVAHVDGSATDISLNYLPNTGFTFDYPMKWLNEETEYKAIGIRRLKVIPTSHVFGLRITYDFVYNGVHYGQSILVYLEILPENSLEEIIHYIINTVNDRIDKYCSTVKKEDGTEVVNGVEVPKYVKALPWDEGDNWIALTYTFDYKTGDFTLGIASTTVSFTSCTFKIEGSSNGGLATEQLDHFLKFLNQERTAANRTKLTTMGATKSFTGVWDRKSLQFHASFSGNKRNFIGLNGDFYDSPSIFYDPPTNMSDFWIKFTTDGRTQFLPRYCRFYIGLSFVRNYKNSLVTK